MVDTQIGYAGYALLDDGIRFISIDWDFFDGQWLPAVRWGSDGDMGDDIADMADLGHYATEFYDTLEDFKQGNMRTLEEIWGYRESE